MNGWEITCVVTGIILMFLNMTGGSKYSNWKDLLGFCLYNLTTTVVYAAMIILPLYFNYWRK